MILMINIYQEKVKYCWF